MRIISKFNTDKIEYGFQEFKVIVEITEDSIHEVDVLIAKYPNRIAIQCKNVILYPYDLTASCSRQSVPAMLLNLRICKFVFESYPDLQKIEIK